MGLISVDDILEASGNDFGKPLRVITQDHPSSRISTWSHLNSILKKLRPLTKVASSHLIAAPVHEFQTLLTVLMQAQGINAVVMGESKKTIISLDLGLYHPAKQLQMARSDLNQIILHV